MFENQLKNLGLTQTQSIVLDFLLEYGESRVREITKATPHPRGVVYKALEELAELNLIEKTENTKEVAKFKAKHPRGLEKILEEKELKLRQRQKTFEELLPSLISNYNLTINKPGVIFYEGEEGMRKILDDTLKSQTEVLLFLNVSALSQEEKFKTINDDYKQKRERAGVKKKIIRVGQKPANTFGQSTGKYAELTEIRYIEKELPAFKSSIQIYDNKISYQILDGENIISILAEDKNIYEMQKALFDLVWEEIAK